MGNQYTIHTNFKLNMFPGLTKKASTITDLLDGIILLEVLSYM